MQHDDEQILSGGFVSTVTRRGDEVFRSMGERHEYVHELLRSEHAEELARLL